MTNILQELEIVDAYYSSAENDNVTVLLRDAEASTDNNLVIIEYNIEPKEGDADWEVIKAIGWDHSKLFDSTAEYKRQQSGMFNTLVNQQARKIAEEMVGTNEIQDQYNKLSSQLEKATGKLESANKEVEQATGKILSANKEVEEVQGKQFTAVERAKNGIFQFIWDNKDNKDELFKFKLWALELEETKSADKKTKSALRKAKSIIEGYSILTNI